VGLVRLVLADIARRLGRDDSMHVAEVARITAAIVDRLWSEDRGLFLACDARSGRQLQERTVAGVVPLVLPDLPTEVAQALVATATGEAFGIGALDVRGVPSLDLTDVRHEPRRYWRGPTWLNTTWLVARGLPGART
jgi:hypothetical protein